MPDDQEYQHDVPRYLHELINLAWDTQNAMFDVIQAQNNPNIGPQKENQHEDQFKQLLQRLFFRYEPKFNYSKKVEISSDVREALDDGDVTDLSFNQARQLCRDIRNLQEEIGHTKFEREGHVEQGYGPDTG